MEADFEKIKKKTLADRGFDFGQYNESYVKRRINVRIMALGFERNAWGTYLQILEQDPSEYARLFDAFSINVTEFFRDASVWEVLEKKYFPEIIAEKRKFHLPSLQIWSAGCSTGEEPYSIAMLLYEILQGRIFGVMSERSDVRRYNPGDNFVVTIMATDIDQDAITKAQEGIYSERSLKNVKSAWLKKYFVPVDVSAPAGSIGGRSSRNYQVRDEIRRMVTFKKRNLLTDMPYKMTDIIFCRNMEIYLTPEMKTRLMGIFYQALVDGGMMIIGKSEMVLSGKGQHSFLPLDARERIYIKEPFRPTGTK